MSSRPKTTSTKVVCPDCGEVFSSRGMAAHRRFKHPESFVKAKPRNAGETEDEGPRGPLPAATHVTAEACVMQVLARIEARLARLEMQMAQRNTVAESPPAPGSETTSVPDPPSLVTDVRRAEEKESMDAQTELDEILLEIAALRTSPEEAAEGDDERGVRHGRLGELRRRQAELMYGLGRDDAQERRNLLDGLLSDAPIPDPA